MTVTSVLKILHIFILQVYEQTLLPKPSTFSKVFKIKEFTYIKVQVNNFGFIVKGQQSIIESFILRFKAISLRILERNIENTKQGRGSHVGHVTRTVSTASVSLTCGNILNLSDWQYAAIPLISQYKLLQKFVKKHVNGHVLIHCKHQNQRQYAHYLILIYCVTLHTYA